MVKKIKVSLILLALLVSIFSYIFTSENVYADTTKDYVIDDANILSDSEEAKLEKLCAKASKEAQCDIVIITMSKGYDGSNMDSYIRDILESDYGYNEDSTTVDACAYAVDMSSRADRIITSGIAKTSFSQSDLDEIREISEEYLSDSDYYTAFSKYVNNIKRAIINGEYSPTILEKILDGILIKLFVSVVITAIAIFVMVGNNKAKATTNEMTYAKNHNFKVNDRRDLFINTTVVKRKIETNHGGGGHGGGGHGGGNSGSSGGHF